MDYLLFNMDLSLRKMVLSSASVYALYYLYRVVHRPNLVAKDGKFKDILKNHLSVLNEHYWPTFWAFSCHFQTLFRPFLKTKQNIPFKREIIYTDDGGEIALDCIDNDEDNKIYPNRNLRPVVIILPGIVGCSDANYVRQLCYEAKQLGYSAIVFNNRGMGKTNLKTPRTFCACNGEDLDIVLKYVYTNRPHSPIIMTAISLGGVILTNFLLEKTIKNLVCAFIVSAPWDSHHTTSSLEQRVNWFLYNRYIVSKLKSMLTNNWHMFEKHKENLPYQLDTVMKTQTIREFDDHFTSKTFGFDSLDDYYKASTISTKPLEKINAPVLYLNAKDDPFSPFEGIPVENIKKNSNIALILTDYGGHVGFLDGTTIRDSSFMDRLFVDYSSCMLREYYEMNNNKKCL